VIDVGTTLPSVTLEDDRGASVNVAEFKKPLVLWFFPKADTPGCTNEGNQFRELYAEFQKKGAEIVGVSRDSVELQKKFKDKFGFQYPLLSDPDSTLHDALGVTGRSTVLIGKDGKVTRVWPSVKVDGHAKEVLGAI
jgi:peroxiredoxin Q/BCP